MIKVHIRSKSKEEQSQIHYNAIGNKIAVIKALREATGLGLKEAKDAVEAGVFVIDKSEYVVRPQHAHELAQLDADAFAERCKRLLTAAGAEVWLEPDPAAKTLNADGTASARRKRRRGPSKAERLVAYRCAALTGLLASQDASKSPAADDFVKSGGRDVFWAEFVAKQSEVFALSMLVAETRPKGTIEELRVQRAVIDGEIAKLVGTGIVIENNGHVVADCPPDGALLVVRWCTSDGADRTWFPTEDAAKAALLVLAQKEGRVPSEDGLYLDLTPDGNCQESSAWVTLNEKGGEP